MAELPSAAVSPGDVIVADFPRVQSTKRRPALIVSSDIYHATRPDAILAIPTGQVQSATDPSDYCLRDWRQAGLHLPTAFRSFLITLPRDDIVAVIGRLSARDWAAVQSRLQKALALSDDGQLP
jgi:mRNA interferase MazF